MGQYSLLIIQFVVMSDMLTPQIVQNLLAIQIHLSKIKGTFETTAERSMKRNKMVARQTQTWAVSEADLCIVHVGNFEFPVYLNCMCFIMWGHQDETKCVSLL